jgi:hypothetical protein
MVRVTLLALIAAATSSYRGCACEDWPTHQDVHAAAAAYKRQYPYAGPYSAAIEACEIRFYDASDTKHEFSYEAYRRVNGKWVWSGGMIVTD